MLIEKPQANNVPEIILSKRVYTDAALISLK
jgi:hypothetical protein